MCTPSTMNMMQAGNSVAGGISSAATAYQRAGQYDLAAAGELDAGAAQAEKILRITKRERGAARAAIAANGTKLDEFALQNEQDIQQAGETDAAMAILTGKRRAAQLQTTADGTRSAGLYSAAGGFASAVSGWKGAKEAVRDPLDPLGELHYSNRSLGD